jgi:hypothetical protein
MTQTATTEQTVTTVPQRGRHAAQGKRHRVTKSLPMSRYETACGLNVHGWTGDAAQFPVTCNRCPK